jgi:hypothetical protein
LATVLAATAGVNDFAAKILLGNASTIGVGSEERRDEKSYLGITAGGLTGHNTIRRSVRSG